MRKFDLYTKPGCPFCVKAKVLLDQNGYSYTEYTIGNGVLKEDIQARINALGLPVEVRTVPQIFLNKDGIETYIGGYTELAAKITTI